jgi:hypothetical protein
VAKVQRTRVYLTTWNGIKKNVFRVDEGPGDEAVTRDDKSKRRKNRESLIENRSVPKPEGRSGASYSKSRFSRTVDCLIRRRLLHMIDHHHIHKSLCRLQLQPQLPLHRSEDVRGRVRVVSSLPVACVTLNRE